MKEHETLVLINLNGCKESNNFQRGKVNKMVTPVLERDDKSRMLLKDYQDAASGKTKVSHKKQMKILQDRLDYDQQLREGQKALAPEDIKVLQEKLNKYARI
jgi:hypothetical protein